MYLKDLVDIQMGQSPDSKFYNYDKIGLPFYQGKADFGRINPTPKIWCSKSKKEAKPNDILISVRAPVGDLNINNEQSCIGRGLAAITCRPDVDMMYLYYYLKYLKPQLKHISTGSTFESINRTQLENLMIDYKLYSDQIKISNILQVVERQIEVKENILRRYDLLIKSRFVELISKNKLIYQKVRLKDCCLISSGATPSRKNSEYWDENGINWFKTTELKNNFLIDSEEKISKLGYEKTSVKLLPKHTVLIAMYGQGKTRGMTGYLLNNATTNQACAALISLDIINPKYLWYTMINSYDRLRNMAKGGTQPNLSVSSIKDFEIILPPIDIQNKFTNYIEQINKLKSDVQKSIDETQLLMDSLMQEYFG